MTAPFTSLANVKAYMGISSSGDDALLTALIQRVSDVMVSVMNREIFSSTYTETRNGNGKDVMAMIQSPITAVSSVTVNGTALPASTGFYASGFTFTGYTIVLRGGLTFAKGVSNVVITYTAGYAAVPTDLEQACIETVGLKYKQKEYQGFRSKTLAGETVAFDKGDFPDSVERVLNQYRRLLPLL